MTWALALSGGWNGGIKGSSGTGMIDEGELVPQVEQQFAHAAMC